MIYRSEAFTLRSIVVGGLATTVEDELIRQGKNWAWLARETEIAASTFTAWKNNPERAPDLHSLGLVAVKLGIPLRKLIEACGYPVDDSAGYADRQARASALIAAVPGLAEVAEDLAKLKPDDQDSLLSVIETWLQDRERRRQERKG